jgi:hypothetical protein
MEASITGRVWSVQRNWWIIGRKAKGATAMKWFFLLSFIAAIICSVLWTAFIIWAIVTGHFWGSVRRELTLLAPLVFFMWGAREMFRSFKGIGLDQ